MAMVIQPTQSVELTAVANKAKKRYFFYSEVGALTSKGLSTCLVNVDCAISSYKP